MLKQSPLVMKAMISNRVDLASELSRYSEQRFTGRLDIKAETGQAWHLYFNLGFLVWGSGGLHPSRRWKRQLFACGHPARSQQIVVRESDEFECWDYHGLTLLAQRKAIEEYQLIAVIRGIVREVLFDLFLAVEYQQKLVIQRHLGARPSHSRTGILRRSLTLDVNEVTGEMASKAEQWMQYKLMSCRPDLAPRILQPLHLQQKVSAKVYQNLTKLLTGQRTLRDLAVLSQQNLVSFTRSLAPFVRQHLLGLIEVADFPVPFTVQPSQPPEPVVEKSAPPTKGLVVCIEDNPRDATAIEDILQAANYQCYTIQDTVYALPALLQYEPDLIFLDLVMPIVNGYELCGQIRRIRKFENTPIIILTGRDNLVDRMRAKVVGATDFISKPIEESKLLAAMEKYCRPNPI
jgi:chemotaxis family two-component system response regulator PixG